MDKSVSPIKEYDLGIQQCFSAEETWNDLRTCQASLSSHYSFTCSYSFIHSFIQNALVEDPEETNDFIRVPRLVLCSANVALCLW